MQIKKIIYILLSLTILFISTSCDKTAVETISETSIQTEPAIEYKTIEPPEDGWTLELLNEVTYINGKDIDLPFCLNDLGDNFTFVEMGSNNESHSGMIQYKGEDAFYALSSQAGDEVDRNDKFDYFVLGLFDNLSSLNLSDFLIINGVNLSSTMNDCYNYLGVDDYNSVGNNETNQDIVGNVISYHVVGSEKFFSFLFPESYDRNNTVVKPFAISIEFRENNYE